MMQCGKCGNEIQPANRSGMETENLLKQDGSFTGNPSNQGGTSGENLWNRNRTTVENPADWSGMSAGNPYGWTPQGTGAAGICFHCGSPIRPGDVFCVSCGAPVGGTIPVRRTPTGENGNGENGSKKIILILSIIAGLLVLLLAGMMLWYFVLHDSHASGKQVASESSVTESSVEEAEAEDMEKVDGDMEEEDSAASEDDGTSGTPEGTQDSSVASAAAADAAGQEEGESAAESDASAETRAAVARYLEAYINDINMKHYSELYSAVAPGSNMERTQKSFIAKSHLSENMMGYDITSNERQSAGVYHVTAVERYDVFDHEKNDAYYVKQRCVYKVVQQPDGSWMVSDFVGGVKVLEKS